MGLRLRWQGAVLFVRWGRVGVLRGVTVQGEREREEDAGQIDGVEMAGGEIQSYNEA